MDFVPAQRADNTGGNTPVSNMDENFFSTFMYTLINTQCVLVVLYKYVPLKMNQANRIWILSRYQMTNKSTVEMATCILHIIPVKFLQIPSRTNECMSHNCSAQNSQPITDREAMQGPIFVHSQLDLSNLNHVNHPPQKKNISAYPLSHSCVTPVARIYASIGGKSITSSQKVIMNFMSKDTQQHKRFHRLCYHHQRSHVNKRI